jgi:predicted lipoprotein with Yx(FWY)xxD motif
MKTKFMLFSLTILALIVSACASATPVPPAATSAPVIPVTGLSTDTPAAAIPSGPAAVNIGQTASLGSFLVDSKGMTLYLYTKDSPNTSNCYGSCASYWPPLLTNGAPVAGSGVNAALLGTTQRSDGTSQVTYNSWPLYYYVSDKAAGDTTGQGTKNVWYVMDATGKSIGNAPAVAAATAAPAVSAGVLVNAGQNSVLGSFLVDAKGMTLYVFSNDTANVSNCSGTCATNWPPLLTNGAPIAGTGINAAMLGTITRSDGGIQVTYNGMPLYAFANDKAAGDTQGQGLKNLWYVINPAGMPVTGAPAAPAAAPVSSGSSW